MKPCFASLIIGYLAAVGAARGEVIDSQPGGFTTRQTLVIQAPVASVWADLMRVSAWWSSDHTFSHDARNLTLTARPGGAWEETFPAGGGVRHLEVVFVRPPTELRLEGALGPLQAFGVVGHLTFTLEAEAGATRITETYDVGGHAPGGLDKIAGVVDTVLGAQLARLKQLSETGKAP